MEIFVGQQLAVGLAHWGNPSSTYQFGAENKRALEASRRVVAALLNAPAARDIVFTADATEANNARFTPRGARTRTSGTSSRAWSSIPPCSRRAGIWNATAATV